MSLLIKGNRQLKQKVIEVTTAIQIDYTSLPDGSNLEHILKRFKSKEYLNRNLLSLEKTFESQRSSALNFQQRVITQE